MAAFFAVHHVLFFEQIRQSAVLRTLFDVDRLVADIEGAAGGEDAVTLRSFVPRLLAVAMLESVYDCTM